MNFSSTFNFILVSATLAFSSRVLAETPNESVKPLGARCATQFGQLMFLDIDLKSPRLAKFVGGRAVTRLLRDQPPAFKAVEDTIAVAKFESGDLNFSLDVGDLTASVKISRTPDTLNIQISSVSVADSATPSRSPGIQLVRTVKKEHLDMGFPRLIAAITAGVERVVATDPNVRKVVFSGKNVMNKGIAKQLEEMGFERQEIERNLLSATKKTGASGVLVSSNILSQMVLYLWPKFGGKIGSVAPDAGSIFLMKDGVATTAVGAKIYSARHSVLPANWELVLQVERIAPAATPDLTR